MNIVVDTHIFIWLFANPDKITTSHLSLLENKNNTLFVANISFWEIAIKYQIGKLQINGITPDDLSRIANEMNIEILNIDAQTMANSHQLSVVKNHKDPFDRLLVWFCLKNNYTLASMDKKLEQYQTQGLKLL